MKRAAILGYPLGHSLSPIFQNAAFAAEGLEITYEARATPPEELAEAVRAVVAAPAKIVHRTERRVS